MKKIISRIKTPYVVCEKIQRLRKKMNKQIILNVVIISLLQNNYMYNIVIN